MTRVLTLAGLALSCALACDPGAAQESYPSKPVRIVVSFAAGGPTDQVARVMSAKLTELLGQTFLVENKTGAGGNLGAAEVARAAPDGYTLLMATVSTHAINPGLYKNMPYDPVKDFAPVGQVGVTPCVLAVHPSLPVTDVKQLIALLKANPGKYSYGSGGNGSSAHLSAELFKSMAGVDVVHVPYKGASPALTDVMAGRIVMFIGNLPPAMPLIKAGSVRPLAVTTAQRSPLVPDLPTLAESGLPGYETVAWFGLFAPAGTPTEIVARLQAEVARILREPDIRERIAFLGGEPVGNKPEEFAVIVKGDVAKWRKVVKDANVHVD